MVPRPALPKICDTPDDIAMIETRAPGLLEQKA
jgi:hypothetical protein